MTTIPRYRYIAAQLGSPYTRITELPLYGVEYQRLLNDSGSFKASLRMPNITLPPKRQVIAVQGVEDPDAGLVLSGNSACRAATPDSAALDITNEIWFSIVVRPDVLGANQVLISKWVASGNQRSYYFRINSNNSLSVAWSTDGTTNTQSTISSVDTVDLTTGSWIALAAHVEVNDGSGNYRVQFYTSDELDSPTWSAFSTEKTGSATSPIFTGTGELAVSGINEGTSQQFTGRVAWMELRDGGSNGAIVANPNFSIQEEAS